MEDVAPKLDAGLIVVVVVGADAAGGTSMVVEVVVGDGMTIPEGGNETTPNEEVSVGPCG